MKAKYGAQQGDLVARHLAVVLQDGADDLSRVHRPEDSARPFSLPSIQRSSNSYLRCLNT